MNRRFVTLSGLAAIAAVLSSCSNQSNSSGQVTSLSAAGIVANASLTPATKSDRLADTAEQLLSVQGFDYANDVADLALVQDSTNVKAQFIKAILAPIMVQRGIVNRVAPLAALDPQATDSYNDALAQIDTQPDSTLKTFLLDGPQDIKTESDVQAHLDSLADAFGKIRDFAKSNKGSEIVMKGTDIMFQALAKRQADLCTVTQSSPYNYSVSCPSQVKMLETTIDRGDLEVIQQTAAGMELYLSLYNSYDLSGAIKVAQGLAAQKKQSASAEEILTQLLKDPKFATLRAGNGFKKVKALGADAITGIRWVMANQAKLCPMGKDDVHNRVGALINTGICVDAATVPETNKTLHQVESVLNGSSIPFIIQTSQGKVQSQVKPSALLDNPIADLRSLSPLAYDKCGNLNSIGDKTLGGSFPNGDFNLVLQQNATCP